MLRISSREGARDEVVLTVEGSLAGAWVEEARVACEALLKEDRHVALELQGLTYVDPAGAELLGALRADSRVVISTASSFVVELLKGGAA